MENSYFVFGIGNALVDIEYSVNDQVLKDQNIDKGMMTLVGQRLVKAFR